MSDIAYIRQLEAAVKQLQTQLSNCEDALSHADVIIFEQDCTQDNSLWADAEHVKPPTDLDVWAISPTAYGEAYWNGQEWRCHHTDEIWPDVTHWRPLPIPPKTK